MLEFRKMQDMNITDRIIFTLSLKDAIQMVQSIFLLITKQSTFRTMHTTGRACIMQYFSQIIEK